MTKEERDALVRRIVDLEQRLHPPDRSRWPEGQERSLLQEEQYQVIGEYADRLPRMVLSRCPHCGEPLHRAFDPFGLDGPWWAADPVCEFEEPAHCEHFRVLLGALSLNGREPVEVAEEVRPGPDVPFVVPAVLELPGMVAVVGRILLATGDTAYPIGYFSTEQTDPALLHQPWCRNFLWFQDDDGNPCWTVSNDKYDFDLETWLRNGRLKWVDLGDPALPIHPVGDEPCPFVGLPGDRQRQILAMGTRSLGGLPTGEPYSPFE